MRISLTVEDTVLDASLSDHETARDFVSLLPLTLRMGDHHGREKVGRLQTGLADGGPRQHSFEIGDVVYWPPGPDVAIFYDHDGRSVPDPGIVVLARIGSGVEVLGKCGDPVEVTIDVIG